MPRKSSSTSTEREEIRKVLDRFCEGLRTRNLDLWRDLFVENTRHLSFRNAGGETWVPNFRHTDDWFDLLALEDFPVEQYFYKPTIHVRGPVAVVWSSYELFREQELSHGGIDCFTFVKIRGKWRIFSILSTQEPKLPPAAKKRRAKKA